MAGTARKDASPKRFELCSIFGGVISNFRARHLLKRRKECSGGISPSLSPWMNNVEHETFAMILLFGKRSLNVHATKRPMMLCTAARIELKAETRINPPTGYCAAKNTAGPLPRERPNKMICE
mmetsp:Transcript_9645/g.22152  ORF Transcript_9645/g.22152 Transcript_9645/m.22152 type:complete len:123 (+) Transcript_9645:352-720(+)